MVLACAGDFHVLQNKRSIFCNEQLTARNELKLDLPKLTGSVQTSIGERFALA